MSPSLKGSYDAQNVHGTLDTIADIDKWIKHVHLLDMEIEGKRQEWSHT